MGKECRRRWGRRERYEWDKGKEEVE